MSRKPPSRRNQWFSKVLKRRSRRQARTGRCRKRLTPVECLEARKLLAITPMFAAGQLTVTGDGANDTVSISTIDVAGSPQVTVNGQSIGTGVDASAVTSIVANLGGGNDTMNLSSLDFSKFTGLTNNSVTLNGQSGNDTLTGTSLGDILDGGDGNDTLDGGAGDDHLIGGSGNDTLIGGAGDDLIDCGLNNDVVSFSGIGNLGSDTIVQPASGNLDTLVFSNFGGAITIDIGTTALQVARVAQLSLTLSDANGFDNVQGTAYADTIYGNSGGNSLMGNGGDDTIYGRGGNDWLDGGAGNDYLYGEDGADNLLGKGGNDFLHGGTGDDTLNGNEGNDYLAGAEGDDCYVVASYGNKTLAEAQSGGRDQVDVSSQTLVGPLDLGTTSSQQITASLSVQLTAAGAIEDVRAGKRNDSNSDVFTVPGIFGRISTVSFTYLGASAAYKNPVYVYEVGGDGVSIKVGTEPILLFTSNVNDPLFSQELAYPAGTKLSFFIKQNGGERIYAIPHWPNLDYVPNPTNPFLAPVQGDHVVTYETRPGEFQLEWEDLFKGLPNPLDLTYDGDFNDVVMQVRTTEAAIVDLDIDSDNNNGLFLSRSPEEDGKELEEAKKVVVNTNDTDEDGIRDYADSVIPGKHFVQLVVELPVGIPLDAMTLTVSYEASNPALVSPAPDYMRPLLDGAFRIWNKDADFQRNPAGVMAGGHFVAPGVYGDLASLGFGAGDVAGARKLTLYVEGVESMGGIPESISVTVQSTFGLTGSDEVKALVVDNRLVIGIDGTAQESWLAGPDGQRSNGLWSSHVRNLVDDSDPFAMTIYDIGPGWDGYDTDDIFESVLGQAGQMIADAGGGTTVALFGWSRGAMVALWVANRLAGNPATYDCTVAYVGMLDPVDMASPIPSSAAQIAVAIGHVDILGPSSAPPTGNVDYPVGWPSSFSDIVFVRMSLNDWIESTNESVQVSRYSANASHGAFGGLPGFNPSLVDVTDGGTYDYVIDMERSIAADGIIRAGLRAAGFLFVPLRDAEWYGFPEDRPT